METKRTLGVKEITLDQIHVSGAAVVANGSVHVALSGANAPAGVSGADPDKWMALKMDGVEYYIPMWT